MGIMLALRYKFLPLENVLRQSRRIQSRAVASLKDFEKDPGKTNFVVIRCMQCIMMEGNLVDVYIPLCALGRIDTQAEHPS